jgi:hypothetical protein
MTTSTERLDRGFSLFNCHVNDARKRADAEFVAQFGQEAYDQFIAPFDAKGIMTILDEQSPSLPYAMSWITLVTAYVNESGT